MQGIMPRTEIIKENRSWRDHEPLSLRWVVFGVILTACGLALAAHINRSLPAPKPGAPRTRGFSGILAHEFLVNLTSIGPRVAGSYENEVLAVGEVVRAVKRVAAQASRHNHVELDLHRASGAFPLTFFDGMNNVYRDVQSVVVRVRGAGGSPRGKRSALLLNCHFDTVSDSPGASDDGAGCAVLLEVLRALAATRHPLKHDAIFLFNGAEENIMQASHAFVTTHKWASTVRAFINIDACGAGGREVLFQAGPHDPWIIEVYAGAVPHPFASSLAQEMFQSGMIPGDTDFRIFRDFGKLSGVDLAWSSNGYVYHTHLDTADRVPPEALQRTGDNVLALAHGLLASESLETDLDVSSRQPVFFDILGLWLVCARAPLAAAIAGATLVLLFKQLQFDAAYASKRLYVSRGAWWRATARALAGVAGAHVAGLGAAAAAGLGLHAAGARLAVYSRAWLLAPLYGLPALAAAWWTLHVWVRSAHCGAVPVRGWWAARLVAGAVAAGWGLLLLGCVARGLRSGFVPLQWTLLLALATRTAQVVGAHDGGRLACWSAGALLPLLQTWYLALASLQMVVPIMGRAGTSPLPPDVILSLMSSGMALAAYSWLLPAVAASRGISRLALAAVVISAITAILVITTSLGAPYSPTTPQRFMVFHTRRTVHTATGFEHSNSYWVPHLDANTPFSLKDHVPEVAAAKWIEHDCALWPYCGVPYFLPGKELISRGYTLPASSPPDVNMTVEAKTSRVNATTQALELYIAGPTHIVIIVSPVAGANISWCSLMDSPPLQAANWGSRLTYFFALFDARAASEVAKAGVWKVTLHIDHSFVDAPDIWATLSVGGHGMSLGRTEEHAALFARFPDWTAPTGWGVHMHLLNV